jgi:hypothetical protein
MDHPIHTYPMSMLHTPVHHDCRKFPKLSAMGEHPL